MRTFGLVLVAALVVSATAAEAQVLCVEIKGGKATRRDVKFRDGSTCKKGEQELEVPARNLPASGPAGPQGPTGPAGPAGPQGAEGLGGGGGAPRATGTHRTGWPARTEPPGAGMGRGERVRGSRQRSDALCDVLGHPRLPGRHD